MSLEFAPQDIPDHPQDWTGGLDEYLSQNGVSCAKATPIQGGISCFLWRLDGLREQDASADGRQDGEPVVLKCADSMAKMAPVRPSAPRLSLDEWLILI
jgi:hypothetical protein